MRNPRVDGLRTRQSLLAAASEVFAARGFRAATVAEICRKAGANVAAANYHFGSKGELYVEAWRYALARSLESHPVDGGVPPDAPAEERFRGRLRSIMRRIVDPKSHDFDILHKEMASPTGILADAIRESLEPLRLEFAANVRELLGEGATDRQVRLCHMSVMAQCFGPLLRERRRKSSPLALPGPEPLVDDVDTIAAHVASFSLAGIREMRRRAAETPHRSRRSK